MIERYKNKKIEEIWNEKNIFETWLKVELAVCVGLEKEGFIPAGTCASLSQKNIEVIPERIREIEQVVRHDFIAFLNHIEEQVNEEGKWIHYGLTSSDIIDTSTNYLIDQSLEIIKELMFQAIKKLTTLSIKHKKTLTIGRSHGIHAEPTTFGFVLLSHLYELARSYDTINTAKETIRFGSISGAVGNKTHINDNVETIALEILKMKKEIVATQIIPRDRLTEVFYSLVTISNAIERFATNIRNLQRTEIGEIVEYFSPTQRGSSAMPHKRNPVLCENLCGLARVMRGNLNVALENNNLWHERDISHSSAERIIIPDMLHLAAYMLEKFIFILDNIAINEVAMLENLNKTNGLWASEKILLSLLKNSPLKRHEAYKLVQTAAMRCIDTKKTFKEEVLNDKQIMLFLTPEVVEDCCSLEHILEKVSLFFPT